MYYFLSCELNYKILKCIEPIANFILINVLSQFILELTVNFQAILMNE